MAEFIIHNQEWIVVVTLITVYLPLHFLTRRFDFGGVISFFLIGLVGIASLVQLVGYEGKDVPVSWVVASLTMYGVALYVILSDILRFYGAVRLTRRRGKRWLKEMEYPVQILGLIGILGSIYRLEIIKYHFVELAIIWPTMVTTAVVIKLVKTRGEIAGWDVDSKTSV